jgi:ribosome-binding factor A
MRDLSDPRLVGVIISRVEMPDDMSFAKVHVRREGGVTEESEKRAMLKGLSSASGRLRRDLARLVALRYTPALRFFYDDAPDEVQRIEELLREVKNEKKPG